MPPACHYKHDNEAAVRQGVGQCDRIILRNSFGREEQEREFLRAGHTRSYSRHKALLASPGDKPRSNAVSTNCALDSLPVPFSLSSD